MSMYQEFRHSNQPDPTARRKCFSCTDNVLRAPPSPSPADDMGALVPYALEALSL